MRPEDVERLRRSCAMAGSLPSEQVLALISAYVTLAGRHERIKKELENLQRPFADVRAGLSRIKHLTE